MPYNCLLQPYPWTQSNILFCPYLHSYKGASLHICGRLLHLVAPNDPDSQYSCLCVAPSLINFGLYQETHESHKHRRVSTCALGLALLEPCPGPVSSLLEVGRSQEELRLPAQHQLSDLWMRPTWNKFPAVPTICSSPSEPEKELCNQLTESRETINQYFLPLRFAMNFYAINR